MRFHPTPLAGVLVVESATHADARGSFQRLWCAESFARAGLDFAPAQASLSTNTTRHTLRGLHWQEGALAEQKLVRCLAGAIWDLALDLRPESPTFRCWHGVELTGRNGRALFLPRGVAHGFLTLSDLALVDYLIDRPHSAEAARGARWNDPAFAIAWPHPPALMSDRDRDWPDIAGVDHG